MGDPHNPARIGEIWNPLRWNVLATEIEAIKDYGALSGGWAWHYMSPPHKEEKHLHDHRDIDIHVFPERFAELVVVLKDRGYHRQTTRFDDPSGEFIRFEKHVLDACPTCYEQALVRDDHKPYERHICCHCDESFEGTPETVKVIYDLFVHKVPTIEVNGYTVVEPVLMLTFYDKNKDKDAKHGSNQCVAVQAARKIVKAGGEIVGNKLLVGEYAL